MIYHNKIGDNMIIRTILIYISIVLAYRIMGKKEVGELSIIDLIVTILIADFSAIGVENYKDSIMTSFIPIVTIVLLQIVFSYMTLKSNKIRNFIEGRPSTIIKKGKVCFKEMTKLRYSLDDLMSQLRSKGVKSIEEVDYAILENNGSLSVFQKEKNYPMPIILDGVIDYDTLKEINKDYYWINNLLIQKNLKLEDIFYAFYTKNRTFIIKKSDLV